MALSVGKQAGKMHIRVLPNTKHFPRELKKELDKFEKMFSFSVPVDDVRLRKAQVRQSIQRQLDTLDKFKVNADVDAHTKKARAQIEEITRDRKIGVLPDIDTVYLNRMRATLKRSLESIEPTLKPTVDDDETRARINRLASEFDKLDDDMHISVISPEEAARIRHRINEIGDELDEMAKDRTVHVDVNPFTSWASARLAWLTRPRMVEIIPRVSKAALAKAAAAIAALSGARLSFDYMKRFSDWISEVDKKLPRITFGTLGLTTAFSALMASVSGIVGLGDGLAATLPSLLLVPGLLAGAAMSGVALFVALKDSKDQLAELGDDYTNLGGIIKDAFWGEARDAIVSLSNSIMPQLERSFDKTSLAIGRFTKKLMGSFEKEFAGGRLEAMFDGLAAGWDELAKGTDAFAGAITNLGLVASRYMPRLAAWFVRQADTFDNWLSDVATDGRLGVWIEEAIESFYALWDVMAATTGIFSGLWKAAEAAGSKGLRGFADMLMAWDKAVNGAKWQATLTSMFRGAGTAMSGFADGLKRVGDMLYVQRDTIEYFMGTAGVALGGFIGDIADALARPEFSEGMTRFIDGIAAGLESLAPALPALSDAFGSLLGFMGDLGATIGPVLADAFIALAPALTEVLDALSPLLPQLGEAMVDAIGKLTPVIANLTNFIVDVMPGAISVISNLVRYAPEIAGVAATIWAASQAISLFAGPAAVGTAAASTFGSKLVGIGRFLISPWGIALTAGAAALAVLDAALDASTANALELETGLKQGVSALDTMRDKAGQNEQGLVTLFADVSQHLDNLPALADKAATAGRGFWSSMSFNENAALDSIKAFGDTLAKLSHTDLPAAQSAFAAFVNDGALNNTQALTFLNEEMGSFKLQLIDAASAAGLATDDATLLALALGKISPAADTAANDLQAKFNAETLGTIGADASEALSQKFADGLTVDGVDVTPFGEKGAEARQAFDDAMKGGTLGEWTLPEPSFTQTPYEIAGSDAGQAFDTSFNAAIEGATTPVATIDLTPWSTQGTQAGEAFNAAVTLAVSSGTNLASTGLSMATSIAAGVTSGQMTVVAAVGNLVTAASQSLSGVDASFNTAGNNVGVAFANGITAASAVVSTAAKLSTDDAVKAFTDGVAKAQTAGDGVGKSFASGISGQSASVSGAAATLASAAASALRHSATGSFMIGVNFGAGFAQGMRSQIGAAAAAAASLAQSASSAAKANLDVRSPSRVARYEIGQMFGEGYVLGLLDKVPAVGKAAGKLTDATVNGPKHSAVIKAPTFATPGEAGRLRAYREQSIRAGGNTTNVTANFMQPDQRDQFREFKSVLDRALR